MRWTLLIIFLSSLKIAAAQTIPNYKKPLFVSHLAGTQKTMLMRAGAPKHNALTKVICFKYPCRGVIGWTRTQQRNKFKRYKKPGIPRLRYLKNDSLKQREPQTTPTVFDSVAVASSQPTQPIEKDTTIAFVFDDVLFDTNSSHLKDAFTKRLDSLSGSIKRHNAYKITIIGHTDNSGTEKANLKLSKDRAEAVASYLASTGISESVITAEGRGSSEPLAANTTIEGRQKNRRVQVVLSFH
jgi:outer membrane protein OmpA-like peptidoglycan-associated protein